MLLPVLLFAEEEAGVRRAVVVDEVAGVLVTNQQMPEIDKLRTYFSCARQRYRVTRLHLLVPSLRKQAQH